MSAKWLPKNRVSRCWSSLVCFAALFTIMPTAICQAEQLKLEVGASYPTMLAGEKQTNYVRIALTGFDTPENEDRPPVNTAIVIDQSGSMQGKKIEQAKKAAIAAVERLRDEDIVSVVLYADSATVLVPATKASDRETIISQIRTVQAKGSTALFAGVSKGAAEVRKFLDKESVNRVILLSDGQANVGPQSPQELERLGTSLVKEGISVSTLGLGLGYNEDLMSRLAVAGSGNHLFVENAENLVGVFQKEFNDLMSVVATDFEIHAKIGEGIRPVRVLNTKADISGQDIYLPLAQLYARQQRYFVVEVEVEPGKNDTTRPMAEVSVEYKNLVSKTTDKLASNIEVRFTNEKPRVAFECDTTTLALCTLQLANEKNIRATALRDAGKILEAKQLLNDNSVRLKALADTYQFAPALSKELLRNVELNRAQSVDVEDEKKWVGSRKMMRQEQVKNSVQQTYRVDVPPKEKK